MKVRVNPNEIKGSITIPPSKSYAHRILMCASLSSKSCVVKNLVLNDDVSATMGILEKLGARFEPLGDNSYKVYPIDRQNISKNLELFACESGSTLRFMLPVLSALGVEATVDGKEGLRRRPIKLLLDVLREKGATIDGDALPVKMSGGLVSGVYEVDATQSSQNLTGLMFALSLLDGDSEIVLKGTQVSKGYVDITLEVMKEFGVKIEKTPSGYKVKGCAKFTAPSEIFVEGDYSSACFHIALGSLVGDIRLDGLKRDSSQGDKEMIGVIQKMGGDLKWEGNFLVIKKSNLKAVSIDATDIPDAIPIISVCCACSEGVSKIIGVDRLKIKESDRLKAVMDILGAFGVSSSYSDNTLFIVGGKSKTEKDIVIDGYNDHRIVMSAVVMAIIRGESCVVTDAQAINKSYPAFFEDLKRIGGENIAELF